MPQGLRLGAHPRGTAKRSVGLSEWRGTVALWQMTWRSRHHRCPVRAAAARPAWWSCADSPRPRLSVPPPRQ